MLVTKDPEAAGRVTRDLAALLRVALRGGRSSTLAAELELVRHYVAIEQVRFAERLHVVWEIAPEAERCLVPELILQPLVENAIRHGATRNEAGGMVTIRASRGERLVLEVLDDGCGFDADAEDRIGLGADPSRHSLRRQASFHHRTARSARYARACRAAVRGGTLMRVVIADDEPLAREALRDALGGVEIVAECASGAEAKEAIERLRPDVAFLDVEMPGVDGVTAARDLDAHTAIVFVTAHDEYAVEAFALDAVDYILKPIDEGRVAEALRRVEKRTPRTTYEQRFIVGAHGKLIVIAVRDVRFMEAAGNYVRLHTAAVQPLLRGTLASLEQRIDPKLFVRVHRSFIVNATLIVGLRATRAGDYEVILRDGGSVPMSRTFRDSVLARLGRG